MNQKNQQIRELVLPMFKDIVPIVTLVSSIHILVHYKYTLNCFIIVSAYILQITGDVADQLDLDFSQVILPAALCVVQAITTWSLLVLLPIFLKKDDCSRVSGKKQ